MKLLFDQNLSRKLPQKLADIYPGSTHVILEGLDRATDLEVRQFAAKQGFVIVTRDGDFVDLNALFGSPPKTVWMDFENAPTSEFERVLHALHEQIEAFSDDPDRSLLIISSAR